jgi:hypothetical protein
MSHKCGMMSSLKAKPARRGRPRKSPDEKHVRVALSFAPEAFDALEALTIADGSRSRSAIVSRLVLAAAKRLR